MGEFYFKFKQFGVHHGIDSLKVCTDSCILGAFADTPVHNKILDIGTGSGLIALMMAQRLTGTIDGVEIMHRACQQASINFANSPWAKRLKLYNTSIIDFANGNASGYDLITCNPPFYANHAQADQEVDSITKHEKLLNQMQLASSLRTLLADHGKAFILYPLFEMRQFQEVMRTKGLFPQSSLMIRNFTNKDIFRVITCFSFKQSQHIEKDFTIYERPGLYTKEFSDLMRDYYLIFE